jgi:hypothetical protein
VALVGGALPLGLLAKQGEHVHGVNIEPGRVVIRGAP